MQMGASGTYGRRDRKDYRGDYNKGAVDKSVHQIPVRVGEEYGVKIGKVSSQGLGVAQIKNFLILVTGAKKGEKHLVRITKVMGKHAEAKLA